jgi:hypothetical protein
VPTIDFAGTGSAGFTNATVSYSWPPGSGTPRSCRHSNLA